MDNKSFVFYKSFLDSIRILPEEERLKAYDAIAGFAIYGEEPQDSGLFRAIFEMAKPQIEANQKRRADGSRGGRPKKDDDDLEDEEADETKGYENEKPVVSENKTSGYENKKPNVNVNDNVNANENTNVKESIRTPARETAKKHGKYEWVKLTDSQYSKLCADLGVEETERCIRYVDESAQSTGNKNKWRDWNLVIRRCSRDKWGVKATGARDRPQNKFINFKQRDNDLDALAAKLAVNSMKRNTTEADYAESS